MTDDFGPDARLSDAELSRREFLGRTAAAAGVALGALPASGLLREAARAQAAVSGLPSPRNVPIDHVVILMMENRSFDHYFGWLSSVADAVQQQTFIDGNTGRPISTHPATTLGTAQWQGCGHPDPGHGWDQGRAQLKGGFLAKGSGNDIFALSYYNDGQLGFIQPAAKAFTLYDRYFCSLLASTWPNRYYKWSAQSGGRKNNTPPLPQGNQWPTIFDRALAKGLTATYYNSDLPFSAVWGPRAIPWTRPAIEFFLDCALGTLSNITIIDPPFRDGGGFNGNSADEHPLGDVRLGQAFMSDVVHAFMSSKNYRRGALFIVYDEWGGFFDHVAPPSVPDDRASTDLNKNFGQMGFRTPAVAISPYARRAQGAPVRVDHGQYGHESILKFIEYRWGLTPLVTRDRMANNIGLSFDWDNPRFEPPDLPHPHHIVSMPCALGGGDLLPESYEAHANDLADLEGLAHRFGFRVGDGKPHELFREPDRLLKALRASR